MAMAYEKQLAWKQAKVKNNLMRLGGFDEVYLDAIMEPIAGMQTSLRYRNKAQYPIGRGRDGRLIAGFYAGRTHSIIENTDCQLGAGTNALILRTILSFMEKYHIEPYDEQTKAGLVRHVLIRTGFTTGEIMVCLVINGKELAHADILVKELMQLNQTDLREMKTEGEKAAGEKASHIRSISLSINMDHTNVIMGSDIVLLYGEPYITDYIGNVAFRISPLSFFQVNPVQTKVLYDTALEYAALTGGETVWDLYCGIGTISLFLADKAKRVCGVEVVQQAIEDARQNARLNGIENAEFFVGKAEEVLPEYYERRREDEMSHPDVIVVDPPRKGCDAACLETMLAMRPKRIVYVSCDSATLARDLKVLCGGDYRLERVRPVDMFGHTVHVETVVLLSRK